MKRSLFIKPVLLAAGVSLLAAGCVVREEVGYRGPRRVVVAAPVPVAEVEVNAAPPAPIVETVTVSPDPSFVWIGGAWMWNGGWVWEAGHWGRRPHPGAIWVPHRYVFRGGRHVWVRGYWR